MSEKKDKNKTILDKIRKVVLGEDVQLAEMELGDGSKIFAEKFESGESVYLMDGETRVALPTGEYELSDGKILVVTTEGVIDEIKDASGGGEDENLSSDEVDQTALAEIAKGVEAMNKSLAALKKENTELKTKLSKPKGKGVKTSPEGKGQFVKMNRQSDIPSKMELATMSTRQRVEIMMANTPFFNNVKLATTTTITTTYAGESAGEYIAAATLQGVTLGSNAITIKPNVKDKLVVKRVSTSGIIGDSTCDFTPTGDVDIDERILEPKRLQVNLELCKEDFRSDWEAIQMGYGAFDRLPPSFQAFLAQEFANISNEAVEQSIWHGDASNDGEFDGFIPQMTADATVLDVASPAAGGVTASNVIDEIGKTVDLIPQEIYNTEDLTVYIAPNVARAYTRALGGFAAAGVGANGYNNQGTVGAKPLNFDGVPLFVANGMNSSYMVAAQKRNLWYGTGLLDDKNKVKIIDMEDVDGSENVRFIMKFTGDTQYGFGAECVLYTPA